MNSKVFILKDFFYFTNIYKKIFTCYNNGVTWCYTVMEVTMAYFLKKSNLKKGLYLQIYESFYDSNKKNTSHKSFKSLGYVNELIASGIEDPITHFSDEVKKLNDGLKRKKEIEKMQLIEESPVRYLGYFPIKNILDGLNVSEHINLLQYNRAFKFSIYDIMESLIYARCVKPCSKFKTFHEVIPYLYGNKYNFSYDQLLTALGVMGDEYEKIVEIYTNRVTSRYGISTSKTYFDCTNFYFEIDKESAFQKKGPSKEKRTDPIIGLGLLLDSNQLPIAMKLYPGNQSEKPVLRNVIESLKQQNNITGKTIQVADKGLNCAANIYAARKNSDGYIFSKSVKSLSGKELKWVLNENNQYTYVYDGNKELKYKYTSTIDEFNYEFNDESGKKIKFKVKEKRILTFNPSLCEKHRYELNKLLEKAKKLKACQAKRNEYGESSKYVTFSSSDKNGNATDEKVIVEINEEKYSKDYNLAGYNLLVTSELKMQDEEVYDVYHNLWRIEQSFRIMKSELDARPVFCHNESTIKGHFLICYLAVLLTRILEFKILNNSICASKLYDFMRTYTILRENNNKYINITSSTPTIMLLSDIFKLPLRNFYLSPNQIKMMLDQVI